MDVIEVLTNTKYISFIFSHACIYSTYTYTFTYTFTMSTLFIGGDGGSPFEFDCAPGSFITRIEGRSGDVTDAIKVTCSDGVTSQQYGGDGGTPWTEYSGAGFNAYDGRVGNVMDQTRYYKVDGSTTASHGGGGGEAFPKQSCPAGQVFVAVTGRSGSKVDALGFNCGAKPGVPQQPTDNGYANNYTPPVYTPPVYTPPVYQPQPQPPAYPPAPVYQPQPSQPVQTSGGSNVMLWLILFFVFIVIVAVAIVAVMWMGEPDGN